MDTPERGRIGPAGPASRFEDSPVFNFINSLSPIQPVKAVHSTQTFQSLTFASVSSIFSSPHVNLQKESRFLIRNPLSGSSKHEISSDIVDESGLSPGISNAIKLSNCTNVEQDNCNITCSLNEATVDPPDESSTMCSNVPERMHYDCGSPNHNTVPFFAIKLDLAVDDGHTLSGPPQFDQDGGEKRKNLFSTEIELPIENQVGQDKEVGECDWENLISDELLIFDSSTESESCKGDEKLKEYDAKSLESLSSNIVDVITASHRTQSEVLFGPCLQNAAENHPVDQSGEVDEQHGTDCTPQILSATCQNQVTTSDQMQRTGKGASGCMSSGCKVDSKQPRGMRRRCLVFEVAGVSKKGLHNDSDLHPSISLSSNGKSACDDKQSVSLKPVNSPSPRILPGIGLHLNTLAATSKDRIGSQESLAAGKQLINTPCSISPFPPIIARHKRPIKSLDAENSLVPAGTEVLHDDASEAPAFEVGEESSQDSPKKKRRKPENGGESESCRRCNCKKSKCLKLYCECFAAGIYCMEPCSCQGCFNKPIHQETVLATRKQIESRNPLAFAPKVIRAADSVQDVGEETNKTPASARHKRGCNCKKSSCLKKYCECYQGGVGCSESCRCEGCKNAFGRKYGIEEIEHEEKDIEVCEKEKEMPDEGQESANAKKSEQHLLESNLPITPFQICRPSVKLPFSSIGKPPRSSSLSVGYSVSQTLKRCDNRFPRHKTEKHAKAVCEDDTPEILKGSASPSNGVKTASPNGKRVSPPHIGTRMSPNRKGGRKLILKSIPSFPSLNNDVSSEYAINYSENPFNSSPLS